jgi:hypothetical protein
MRPLPTRIADRIEGRALTLETARPIAGGGQPPPRPVRPDDRVPLRVPPAHRPGRARRDRRARVPGHLGPDAARLRVHAHHGGERGPCGERGAVPQAVRPREPALPRRVVREVGGTPLLSAALLSHPSDRVRLLRVSGPLEGRSRASRGVVERSRIHMRTLFPLLHRVRCHAVLGLSSTSSGGTRRRRRHWTSGRRWAPTSSPSWSGCRASCPPAPTGNGRHGAAWPRPHRDATPSNRERGPRAPARRPRAARVPRWASREDVVGVGRLRA